MSDQFIGFAQEFGLPWAITIALGIALFQQMQYERKSTVPREMYDREDARHHDEILATLKTNTDVLSELVNAFNRLELLFQERLTRRQDRRDGD